MGLKQIMRRAGRTLSKNSPTILTGLGVGGVFTTAILAVKATPKALELLDEARDELDQNQIHTSSYHSPTDLTNLEIVKITWKCYIPAVLMGVASSGCIIAANHVNLRRNAALAGLYSITETAFKEYQNKIAQTIGQNKERKIHDTINTDRAEASPSMRNAVLIAGTGKVPCFDALSGRPFESDYETLRGIINDLNKTLREEEYVSLNDFYYEIGLDGTKLGGLMGWHIDKGYIEENFSSTLVEGKPCLVLDFQVYPKYLD